MSLKYKRLSLEERIQIEIGLSHNQSYVQIGLALNRSKSSICREVKPWGKEKYNAAKADSYSWKASSMRKKGHKKIIKNKVLLDYIHEKLELRWSPEQISHALKRDYATAENMQVSYETIYRYVYLHCKKELREELTRQLRRKKKTRGKAA